MLHPRRLHLLTTTPVWPPPKEAARTHRTVNFANEPNESGSDSSLLHPSSLLNPRQSIVLHELPTMRANEGTHSSSRLLSEPNDNGNDSTLAHPFRSLQTEKVQNARSSQASGEQSPAGSMEALSDRADDTQARSEGASVGGFPRTMLHPRKVHLLTINPFHRPPPPP
jgi:hypothetical protein